MKTKFKIQAQVHVQNISKKKSQFNPIILAN